MFTTFDKALAPLVVSAAVFLLGKFGFDPSMSLQDAITMAVNAGLTAAAVYQIKNKK